MTNTRTHKQPLGKSPEVPQDEPGAEERFKGILKRALNTPPTHKKKATERKLAAQHKDKTR